MGYHLKKIEKGVLGEFSKIKEEFQELEDAVEQDVKGLIICELSDLVGAIEEYCQKFNLTLDDIVRFSNLTKSAFKDGDRK
jgi:phosphoribosyl-ATP pyrophosphohydrolase